MRENYLDLYERASTWAIEKVSGAQNDLDVMTACDGWDVRTLMNHMLDTQRYFLASARGEHASPPAPEPPDVLSDNPVADFEHGRAEMLDLFGAPGVQEKAGRALGIAFSDQLLHGWDLAHATKQNESMAEDLAELAYDTIHGQFTDEQRVGVFKPEIKVDADATPQEKLLAYTGRDSG